jgi:hypothetical protein
MSRRTVVVGDLSYVISPDDPVTLGDRFWAVLEVRLLDELNGRTVRGDMDIQTEYRGLSPRVSVDGLVGLVGRPREVFPALNPLDPNAQTYDVEFTVSATRYLPLTRREPIQMIPDFPDVFTPTRIDVELHRQPIVILGRTVEMVGNNTSPLAGVDVSIIGFWPILPPANVALPPADPPNFVSLRPPLNRARTIATGQLRRREMVLVAAQDKHLMDNIGPGATTVRLSDGINLNANDILAIDPLDPDRVEFLTIQTVAPSTTPTALTSVTLTHPVAQGHRRDALVQRALPQAPGFSNPLSRNAQVGDVCIFLNSMTNLGAATVVEVSGPIGAPVEYHRVSRFATTSDADGYFRLPLLSRVAQLDLQADDGGAHPVQVRRIIPNYEEFENRCDFIL